MAITLAALSENTYKQYELKLIAGKKGLENTVRWVHMIEDSEVPDFLYGNELVFTTGIAHSGTEWLMPFVMNLIGHDAAGVVINLGPYIKAVPPHVIVYCEEHDFPLFTMPWKTKIIDITYEFCRRIINNEKTEQTVAEAFRNLIFSPEKKEGYVAALEKSGFHDSSSFTVLSICFRKNGVSVLAKVMNKYSLKLLKSLKHSAYPAAAFIQDSRLTVIRQNSSDEELDRIVSFLGKSFDSLETKIDYHIGISETKKGFASVAELYRQALAARRTSRLLYNNFLRYKDIGVFKVISGVENTDVLKSYAFDVLGSLLDYDKENGTDFVQILNEYINNDGSVNAVAENTGVHRNTVNYRIKQIKAILNMKMSNEDIVNIKLSLHILDLLKLIEG